MECCGMLTVTEVITWLDLLSPSSYDPYTVADLGGDPGVQRNPPLAREITFMRS